MKNFEFTTREKRINIFIVILVLFVLLFEMTREIHLLFSSKSYLEEKLYSMKINEIRKDMDSSRKIIVEDSIVSPSDLEEINDLLSDDLEYIFIYNISTGESVGEIDISDLLSDENANSNSVMFSIVNGLAYDDFIVVDYESANSNKAVYAEKLDIENYIVGKIFYSKSNALTVDEYFSFNLKSFLISISILAVSCIALTGYILNMFRKNMGLLGAIHKEESLVLEELSYKDSLTKLFNRTYFHNVHNLYNDHKPYVVVMGDVNGLKLINDTYGHEEGDRLLTIASSHISAIFDNDTVFRWGGDEFLILTHKTINQVKDLIRQFNNKVSSVSNHLVVSVSFGYAESEVGKPLDDIMRKAEKLMYEMKVKASLPHKRRVIDGVLEQLHDKYPAEKEHTENVTNYCITIGELLKLNKTTMDKLRLSAMLHDIGKVTINESIINSAKLLDVQERDEINKHTLKGFQILNANPELSEYSKFILCHHERYDGLGYPEGLAGDEIPLISRIISIADAFDSMISNRPYKKRLSKKEAIIELLDNSGSQFDPKITQLFVEYLKNKKAN